jgi:signal transduction histidine kinase
MAAALDSPPSAEARPRLLLVDDEQNVLVTLSAVLEQQGYEVIGFDDPAAALAAVQSETFDLLLTDLRLGEFDGLRLVSALHQRDSDAIAIVLTGYASLESALDSINLGVFSYLPKPTDLGHLKETIERGLDKRRLRQALLQVDRVSFIGQVSEELSRTLDYEATLERLARLTIPYLADWSVVDIVDANSAIQHVAVAHVDPAKEELARQVQRRFDAFNAGTTSIEQVLRTGTSYFAPEIALGELSGDLGEMLDVLKPRSLIAVPIRARSDAFGVLSLLYSDSNRRYVQDDLGVAEALGRRAGLLIENARLYAEATTARAQREEFLAAAAHDLQTPITSVVGFAQLIRRRLERGGAGIEEHLMADLRRIETAAEAMRGLVREFLDLARMQANPAMKLDPRPTDLVALTREVLEQCQAGTDQHTLRLSTAAESLVGQWDAERLKRTVANLVGNAVKFSPEGGEVLVELSTADGQPACAVLSVTDCGIGIPADELAHIFERFRRGANVGFIRGTGLGLGYAKYVIEGHGGKLEVCSKEGAGSTFTATLPFTPPEQG